MMRFLAVLSATLLLTAPAIAGSCPSLMEKIDATLESNPNLTPEQAAEVERLREQGEDLHDSGNHEQSVESLQQAMTILGIE
jgi:hypothetical protein